MADSTFEEASRCPKCSKPGEDRKTVNVGGQNDLPRGTTVHLIYCMNELCPWFDTCWNVQVRPDGSVPAPKNHTGEAKIYAGFKDHDVRAKELIDYLKAEEQAQTQPGFEIRNPYA